MSQAPDVPRESGSRLGHGQKTEIVTRVSEIRSVPQ
jgi:hypothetical protein